MGRQCAFPSCGNRMVRYTSRSFHRLPYSEKETLKLWLNVLQMDRETPVDALRRADHRICSDHFDRDDYCRSKRRANPKHVFLRKSAVPRWETPAAGGVQLQDNWTEMNTPQDQFAGTPLNLSEMCASTTEKPTPQHIVDEEAILQLMKNCPKCNRTCRCTKHTRDSYLIAYQKCYFCDYQRKWASQPEAKNMNIHKPHKRKPPKDKVSVNAKAQSSQLNKNISESSSPTTQ